MQSVCCMLQECFRLHKLKRYWVLVKKSRTTVFTVYADFTLIFIFMLYASVIIRLTGCACTPLTSHHSTTEITRQVRFSQCLLSLSLVSTELPKNHMRDRESPKPFNRKNDRVISRI